jgi:hypothetical protein
MQRDLEHLTTAAHGEACWRPLLQSAHAVSRLACLNSSSAERNPFQRIRTCSFSTRLLTQLRVFIFDLISSFTDLRC